MAATEHVSPIHRASCLPWAQAQRKRDESGCCSSPRVSKGSLTKWTTGKYACPPSRSGCCNGR